MTITDEAQGAIRSRGRVETLTDWSRLAELGCRLAQGYFIAKPMPAGAVSRGIGD